MSLIILLPAQNKYADLQAVHIYVYITAMNVAIEKGKVPK